MTSERKKTNKRIIYVVDDPKYEDEARLTRVMNGLEKEEHISLVVTTGCDYGIGLFTRVWCADAGVAHLVDYATTKEIPSRNITSRHSIICTKWRPSIILVLSDKYAGGVRNMSEVLKIRLIDLSD